MSDRTGGRDRWRGFVVLDDRLWYRPPSGRSRRPGLRFEPDALVVVGPDGTGSGSDTGTGTGTGTGERLAWDDGERPGETLARPTWSLHALPRGRGNRVAFRLTIAGAGRQPGQPGHAPRHVRLRSGTLLPSDELPALCRYLAATPAARPGLADGARLRRLLGRLASSGWRRPDPPHEPLAGERLDLHRTVEEALDELDWRRIDQRPIAGEPRPATTAVVAAVREALPDELSARVSDERIRDEVERHLAVGPWPFATLL